MQAKQEALIPLWMDFRDVPDWLLNCKWSTSLKAKDRFVNQVRQSSSGPANWWKHSTNRWTCFLLLFQHGSPVQYPSLYFCARIRDHFNSLTAITFKSSSLLSTTFRSCKNPKGINVPSSLLGNELDFFGTNKSVSNKLKQQPSNNFQHPHFLLVFLL